MASAAFAVLRRHLHGTTARALRHAQSPQRVRRARDTFARRHSESASTRTISAEGLPSSRQIRTAPQRERFDTHDLRRGLAELKTTSHGATARALRHARSPQRAHFRLAKALCLPRNSQTLFMNMLRLPRIRKTYCAGANVSRARRTLCGDRPCRSALAAAPRECVLHSANPLRRRPKQPASLGDKSRHMRTLASLRTSEGDKQSHCQACDPAIRQLWERNEGYWETSACAHWRACGPAIWQHWQARMRGSTGTQMKAHTGGEVNAHTGKHAAHIWQRLETNEGTHTGRQANAQHAAWQSGRTWRQMKTHTGRQANVYTGEHAARRSTQMRQVNAHTAWQHWETNGTYGKHVAQIWQHWESNAGTYWETSKCAYRQACGPAIWQHWETNEGTCWETSTCVHWRTADLAALGDYCKGQMKAHSMRHRSGSTGNQIKAHAGRQVNARQACVAALGDE